MNQVFSPNSPRNSLQEETFFKFQKKSNGISLREHSGPCTMAEDAFISDLFLKKLSRERKINPFVKKL